MIENQETRITELLQNNETNYEKNDYLINTSLFITVKTNAQRPTPYSRHTQFASKK